MTDPAWAKSWSSFSTMKIKTISNVAKFVWNMKVNILQSSQFTILLTVEVAFN